VKVAAAIEVAPKKSFATAVDWPGWSRSGKTPEIALETLRAYAERYAAVAKQAGEQFDPGVLEFAVLEEAPGGSGTEFGVPSRVTDADRRATSLGDAARLASLVDAAWRTFAAVAGAAPAELTKGPRGGGRDTAKIVGHVAGADLAYAREIGIRMRASDDDEPSVAAVRAAILELLRESSDGSPLAGRRWTARYAAHRIAWHALDHAWEIEDRTPYA
jgi:hypothetical protein